MSFGFNNYSAMSVLQHGMDMRSKPYLFNIEELECMMYSMCLSNDDIESVFRIEDALQQLSGDGIHIASDTIEFEYNTKGIEYDNLRTLFDKHDHLRLLFKFRFVLYYSDRGNVVQYIDFRSRVNAYELPIGHDIHGWASEDSEEDKPKKLSVLNKIKEELNDWHKFKL